MSELLQPGDPAPDFTATAVGGEYDGKDVALGDFHGKTLVLYFYPKDDTPGCTTQACGLRDAWPSFIGKAMLFGVSIDPVESHGKFIEKYQLPFPLLADTDRKIVEAYGVWVEKSMYGRKYMGVERATFLIDREGLIAQVWRKVKVPGHADAVLKAAQALG